MERPAATGVISSQGSAPFQAGALAPESLRSVGAQRGPGSIVALSRRDSLTASVEVIDGMGCSYPPQWGCLIFRSIPSGRPEMDRLPDSPACTQALSRDRWDGSWREAFGFPSGMAGAPGCWSGYIGIVRSERRRSGTAVTAVAILGKSVQEARNGGASQVRSLYLGDLVDNEFHEPTVTSIIDVEKTTAWGEWGSRPHFQELAGGERAGSRPPGQHGWGVIRNRDEQRQEVGKIRRAAGAVTTPRLAVELALRRTFAYSGRAGRAEFWWWALVFAAAQAALLWVGVNVPYISWPATLAWLLLFLPAVSATVRRLHDIGRSGWYALLWTVLPVPPLIIFGGAAFHALGAGLAGGDPSPAPFFITLGLAVASIAAVLAWSVWWLRAPSGGPNRYDS